MSTTSDILTVRRKFDIFNPAFSNLPYTQQFPIGGLIEAYRAIFHTHGYEVISWRDIDAATLPSKGKLFCVLVRFHFLTILVNVKSDQSLLFVLKVVPNTQGTIISTRDSLLSSIVYAASPNLIVVLAHWCIVTSDVLRSGLFNSRFHTDWNFINLMTESSHHQSVLSLIQSHCSWPGANRASQGLFAIEIEQFSISVRIQSMNYSIAGTGKHSLW